MKSQTTHLCPKCGSNNWKFPSATAPSSGFINLPQNVNDFYECEDCGYIGIFIDVDKADVKEVQKEIKKN
jgi:predicted nucleic-acid-binding Zn-ribbon protein